MAKVRVRALKKGFDGQARRHPGEEFDFDVEQHGNGSWFELINEVEVEHIATEDDDDLSNKSFKELQEIAAGFGVSGKSKAELIEAIEDADDLL